MVATRFKPEPCVVRRVPFQKDRRLWPVDDRFQRFIDQRGAKSLTVEFWKDSHRTQHKYSRQRMGRIQQRFRRIAWTNRRPSGINQSEPV